MKICATLADGTVKQLAAAPGDNLMVLLRDNETGVLGTCGGGMSCGTCHVVIGADWRHLLGEQHEDEVDMLDALSEVTEVPEGSRLSCQIELVAAMDGMGLRIPPPE